MPPRILIVDDEKLIVQILKDTLSLKGFEVVGFAFDGDSAVKKYFEISPRPDLVIMDHRMPVKNGIEAMDEILAVDQSARILFLSADARIRDIALAKGAIGFISKPFEGLDLLRAIKSALSEQRDKSLSGFSIPKAVSSLFKQGYELGLEIGYYGHMETVGWVSSKRKELLSLAQGLEVVREFNSEYDRGKEDGRHRRVKPESLRREDRGDGHAMSGGGGGMGTRAEATSFGGAGSVSEPSSARQLTSEAPLLVQADIQGLASMFVRYHDSSARSVQELYAMLESMVPLRPCDIPGTGREIIDRGLQALVRSGWVTFYSVDMIDMASGEATISIESVFARCCGRFDHTICRFLEPILGEMLTRAVGRKAVIRETSCIAMGTGSCVFSTI